jgi:hypothetical protein
MKTDFDFITNYSNRIKAMHSCCGGNGHGPSQSHGQNNESQLSTGIYQCPMRCEGQKTYPQPGSCPVCNMKLVPVGNL